jgi:hypothetical protein
MNSSIKKCAFCDKEANGKFTLEIDDELKIEKGICDYKSCLEKLSDMCDKLENVEASEDYTRKRLEILSKHFK